jgi:hypothetical protein
MNAAERTELMLATLDGNATPEQAQALQALLAESSAARGEFETWRETFAGLAAVPPLPAPEGLVDAVATRLALASGRSTQAEAEVFQLFSRPSVLASRPVATAGWFERLIHHIRRLGRFITSQRRESMGINRKVLAGGAFVVVALAAVTLLGGYPPKSDSTLGTVVPAERYRAPQAGAEAVKLGQGEGTPAAPQGAQAGDTAATADKAAAQGATAEYARFYNAAAEKAAADLKANSATADLRANSAAADLRANSAAADLKANSAAADLKANSAAADLKANSAAADLRANSAAADLKANSAAADLRAGSVAADKAAAQGAAAELKRQ